MRSSIRATIRTDSTRSTRHRKTAAPAAVFVFGQRMLILFNKPYGVLCQFTDRGDPPKRTLAEFIKVPDVYPAGRLDSDSEGLLALTDDGALAHRLTDPRHRLAKTYIAQVEGTPSSEALAKLRSGVVLNDGPTLPADAEALDAAPSWLWPRDPPIRFRKSVPDA